MKLLGKNLANRKKEMASNFTLDYVIDYLVNLFYLIDLQVQMLDAIEEVHNMGYIHRDIKPVIKKFIYKE